MKKNIHKALFSALMLLLTINSLAAQTPSIARRWNEAMLQAIREDLARPPVTARNLFHVSMAMWDAWAAYDTLSADTYLLGKTVGSFTCQFDGVPMPADIETARAEAISYAAYRLLDRRYLGSPNYLVSITRFRNLMSEFGYDWTFTSNAYQSGNPAALGNYIADCIGFYGLTDGARENFNYLPLDYVPVNPALNPDTSGNPTMVDPNHWQPLILTNAIDQNGNPIPALQKFQSPEWGRVVPFALADSQKTVFQRNGTDWPVYHDPGPPAFLDTVDGGGDSEVYKWNHNLVSIWSSHLTPNDGVMWDISPASIGDTPYLPSTFQEYKDFYKIEGGGPSNGRPLNPKTGQPYQPQVVPRGDYTRVLAQFWADGPNSETPPGHWFSILNKAMDHPEFVRKFNGTGDVLDPLEYDIKAYFILGGALHDAAIAAWGVKGWYDGTRPVSALRWMADRGQSSDPARPNFDFAGIQLVPGYIEQVEAGDPLAGPNGEHIGKIKLYTWQAFDSISNPATDIADVGWILAEKYWPFQRKTFVTPPFAGYISGHSTYSRSAAEAITLLTGDEYFPGGMGEYHIAANSGFLGVEKGPSVDVTLQWATYRDASDQTSLSRIWGGIHPPEDDIPGRTIGIEVGTAAFYKAKSYFYNNDLDADGYDFTVDCDDENPSVYPGAPEICDGLDNNCEGLVDEGLIFSIYYADADGDGYGNLNIALDTCLAAPPANFASNSLDCFDNDPSVYPGAPEVCDGQDNDCNGLTDDGLSFTTYYEDFDGDGFGTGASEIPSCSAEPPPGFVANNLDCDDNNSAVNPNAVEVCDNLDNDCNGFIDDDLPINVYYADADGDGDGDLAVSTATCLALAPMGYVSNANDCDDTNAAINSSAAEICDGIDNNCNGQMDEGLPQFTYYVDSDADGFGGEGLAISTCNETPLPGYVANQLDCDDTNGAINPNAIEIIDGIDNNCDGSVGTSDLNLAVKTYPNPVQDVLNITLEALAGEVQVQVSSLEGKMMISSALEFVSGRAEISFAGLPSGVYLLRISDAAGKKSWLQRVVKM